MCSHAETYSQRQIPYCYTDGFICAGRDIPVSRNSLTRYNGRHLRILLFGTIYPRRCCLSQRAHELRGTAMPRPAEVFGSV